RFADWPQRCTPESIEKPGYQTGLLHFQHPEVTEQWLLPEGRRWQARYSRLLVCNRGRFSVIHNPWYWITRGHPSLGYSPAGKGHIDHSLLHLDINGKAESPGEGYHAAIARHGHA
ncbi:hypothetical protein, partial [Aeromonas jandaei]|uniref:hypothetical protein n=1 Tax=Aeromonas jandaei TaxID=650 RepID=UPI00366DA3E4